MIMKLYPVAFGHYVAPWNVLKTVEYFSSYEEARKAVIEYRNKPDTNKYAVIQLGYDDKAELMVYNPKVSSWVVTLPCWNKEDFLKNGKLCTLKVPVKSHKEQRMRLHWGWTAAVVELFQTKFGIKFFDVKEKWQEHYKQGTNKKSNDWLEFACIVPESSMRALKESYGCSF